MLRLPTALILFALAAPAAAQAPAESQLDFLAGEWTLHDAAGAEIGRSRVVVQAPAAMLYEERRVGEREAQPLWFARFERDGGWTQLFVGATDMVREFRPVSPPGAWPLVLGGDVTLRDGTPVRFRMTMTRVSDDESGRILEMSRDNGATWSTTFDYRYRRAR
ncbi:MAG: hypothetical protein ACT4N8_11795 [Sphingosinicella sp.]|uniref:hypothetical protein n=1 Tax=Sphingosinicella sp. TaxID=1917971 RepID=UPI004037AA34